MRELSKGQAWQIIDGNIGHLGDCRYKNGQNIHIFVSHASLQQSQLSGKGTEHSPVERMSLTREVSQFLFSETAYHNGD